MKLFFPFLSEKDIEPEILAKPAVLQTVDSTDKLLPNSVQHRSARVRGPVGTVTRSFTERCCYGTNPCNATVNKTHLNTHIFQS